MGLPPGSVVRRWTEERGSSREDPDGRWCLVATYRSGVTLQEFHLAASGEWLPHGPALSIPHDIFRCIVDEWSLQ